jgi:hypothetical protein
MIIFYKIKQLGNRCSKLSPKITRRESHVVDEKDALTYKNLGFRKNNNRLSPDLLYEISSTVSTKEYRLTVYSNAKI